MSFKSGVTERLR